MMPCSHFNAPSSGTASHAEEAEVHRADKLTVDRAQEIELLRPDEEARRSSAAAETARRVRSAAVASPWTWDHQRPRLDASLAGIHDSDHEVVIVDAGEPELPFLNRLLG